MLVHRSREVAIVWALLALCLLAASGVAAQGTTVRSGFNVVPKAGGPAQVLDLAVVDPTTSSLRLVWTAPTTGEPGEAAARYEVRYGLEPVVTWEDWAAAQPLVGLPVPAQPGGEESFVVQGLDPATTYHFLLIAYDARGYASLMSNPAQGTTLAAASPPTFKVHVPLAFASDAADSLPTHLGLSALANDAPATSELLPLRLQP